MKPPLTREEAQAAGYEGYAVHMRHLPCPSDENPKVYCASCAPLDDTGGAPSCLLGFGPYCAPAVVS